MNAQRPVRNPVIIDAVLEFVCPVGDAANHGPHAVLGAIEQLFERLLEALIADLLGKTLHACRADLKRGELRLQVAPEDFRLADVLQDDVSYRPVELAAFDELYGRDTQALLKNLYRARAVAARRGAADIEMVAQRSDKADALPVLEDRLEGNDVRKMLTATIGIVGDDNVVRSPIVRWNVPGENFGEKIAHGIEVARDARGLRNVPAVAVEYRGGVIEQLPHDCRATGAPDRDVHLRGRGRQCVVDDLELDRRDVDTKRGLHSRLPATRWPLFSRRQVQPSASRTVV